MNAPIEITGIMSTVTLGPLMGKDTYDFICNFNNDYMERNEGFTLHQQAKVVKEYQAELGCVFLEVRSVNSTVVDAKTGLGLPMYYAARVFPVCRDPNMRARLLHTFDQLVRNQGNTQVLYNVHCL